LALLARTKFYMLEFECCLL